MCGEWAFLLPSATLLLLAFPNYLLWKPVCVFVGAIYCLIFVCMSCSSINQAVKKLSIH